MDMNRNGMHGAVCNQDNNGQYVQVSTTQSRTPVVPQNAYSQAGQHLSRDVIIKQLLNAKSTEDLLKVQKAALARSTKRATQLKQANQPSQWKPIACKPNPRIDPTSSFQNGLNNQEPVMSSYRMVSSTNSAPQTTQQSPSVPVMQWYTATGYGDRGGQQPMQNTQANVSHVFPHQNVAQPVLSGYSSVRHPVQTPYQHQTSATNSQPIYTFQNGNPGPCLGGSTETNFPVSNQDYRTSQNDHTPTATNYVTLQTQPYVNIISPLQQAGPQWNGNYVQSQTPLANNPMLLVINETPAMPPQPLSYTQSTTNLQSIKRGSVNQQYANQSQNYAAENVQQPHHSAAGQQEKSLAAPVSQTQMDESQNHRSHQRLFTLCQVLKKRYMLLSQENEFLKEKLQDYKNSQDNGNACVGSAPLVSTLQNGPVLTNNVVAGQLSMPQNGPVLNPLQLHSAHGFQGLNVYNTNGVNGPVQSNSQTGQSFHGNVFSNQVPASNRNVLEQNSSVIDGNQMDAGSVAGSTAQGQPENLRGNIHQNMPAETAILHADNQRISGGNPHNGSWSQNGFHVNPLQSLDPSSPVTSESLKEVVPSDVRSDCSSSYKAMFNTKSHFPSGSREAIEAALPLWTSVPQSSSLNKDGPTENEPSLLDAYNLLKEITLPSTNEATPAVSAHKPDLTAPNASKCVEPQIAVVSPLLQCKEMENMLPKGQAKDNMSMNVKENDSFNKILQALESLSTPVKEPEDVAPSPSDIEVSSQKAADPNSAEDIEMADNDFQISGICTLVEGSAYNSSIEMFEESVKTECDTASDVGNNHTIQDSDQGNMTCTSEYENSTLSNTAMVALDVQPAESEEAGFSTSEENLDGTSVHCFGIQNDQSVLSPSEDFGDLEGSSVSDQLSELLSAFPYGIKNYMSENKLDNRERRGKLSESVTFSDSQSAELFKVTNSIKAESLLEPNDESVTFNDSQSACNIDQLTQDKTPIGPELFKLTNSIKAESLLEPNDESVTFSDSQSACNIDQLKQDITPTGPELFKLANGIGAESLLKSTTGHQAAVEPTPTKTVESIMDWILMQFPEDDFEIVRNNPENNIEVTLIPQDEITKIFPNEPPLTPNCQETEADTGPGATSTEESQDSHVNVELNPLEKGDLTVNEAPDKDLFCCLVSRLNHTNRNAPKCNCKLSELHTSDQLPIKSSVDDVTNKTLENLPEISSPNFCKSAGYELKDPEILPLKVTKFEPIKCSSESKKSMQNFRRSQQEEAKQTTSFSTNRVLEVDLGENKTLTLEKSLGSSSQTKKHYPNKMELNVIPQKNKQLHKGKKKDREKKTPRDTHGVVDTRSDNKRALHKNSGRKVLKTPNEEKTSSLKTRSPFTSKHIDRSLNKHKPSPGLVKATPSIAKPKHYERSKNRSESHFEKTRKVITVQEYLQRKRELCNKSNETKIKQSDETERRHTLDEKSTMSQIGSNLLNKHKRPLSPAKIHLTSKTKKHTSETLKEVIRTLRDQQSPGPYESSRKKSRNLDNCHGKETEVKNAKGSERSSSKDKICFVAVPRYQKHKGCRVQQYAN